MQVLVPVTPMLQGMIFGFTHNRRPTRCRSHREADAGLNELRCNKRLALFSCFDLAGGPLQDERESFLVPPFISVE
jgi:hypothetical protein